MKKNILWKKVFLFVATMFFIPSSTQALRNKIELFEGIDYKKVFDQRRVLSKFTGALREEGLPVVEAPVEEEVPGGRCARFFHYITCNFFREKARSQGGARDGYREIDATDETSSEDEEGVTVIVIGDPVDDDHEAVDSSERLDQALVEDFKTNKLVAMRRTLWEPLFALSVDGAIFGGVSLLPNETASGFGQLILFHVVGENIKKFTIAFYSIYISPIGDPLEKYEILYAKRKRFLPRALQEAIEDKFGVARKSDQALDSAVRFLRLALNLPLRSKKLRPLTASLEAVQELLEGYDEEAVRTIKLNFFNHFRRFSRKFIPFVDTPKSVLYLLGPPGVGKTYITEKLAELMDAPLVKLTAIENAESIIGGNDKPGSLLENICRPEIPRNAIILIDEIDRVVNKENSSLQLFLPLLEPDAQYFYSPYLNADVDISHFCFIMAGNTDIENEALRSRLTIVKIDNMNPERKSKIIQTMLPEDVQRDDVFMEEVKQCICSDTDPGIRRLRKIVNDRVRQWEMDHWESDEEEGEVR